MSLPALAIRRPVATAMVYLMLVVVGLVCLRSLPVDLLPEIEFTQLTVRVRYPNVGPAEIEQIVTDPIENAVSGLPNLERVTSESEEGSSRVRLEFARGTDVDEAANDLRAALDRLRDELPVEAEAPEILKLDLDRVEVVSLAATSTRPLEELTLLLENDLARRFEQIPGVGAIEIRGGIYRQVRVELERDRLKATGLTALDVEEALARENVTLPGGDVKRGFADLYVRTLGEYQTLDQIAQTVVTVVDGAPVRVEDVGQVVDAYEDVPYLAEVNGMPSVSLGIQKQSGANTVAVARDVRREVERVNAQRDDVHLTVFADQSEFIRQSIDNVRSSAIGGGLLAVLILYLFLRNRASTAIIALSIPISIVSTFGLLYFGGLTLNQMTFGGLALGVGMIVDGSIVVLESIVRKREEAEMEPAEAARVGATEVSGAIVASTLTTSIIFLPVVFTQTTSGALFQALALVVVFSLVCALAVALTVVPMLSARFLRMQPPEERRKTTVARFSRRIEGWYTARLERAIVRRGRVFAVTGLLLAVSLALFPLIPVELAPPVDADEIGIDVEMAQGTNIAVVRAYLDELTVLARRVLPPEDVEVVSAEVRGGDAELEVKLKPQGERTHSSEELVEMLRAAVDGQVPGAEIRIDAAPGLWILRRVFSSGGGDEDLEIELQGWDLEIADDLAAEIRRRVEALPGITDVRVSRREGQPEATLVLDRDRIAQLGLSIREVARTVQANVGGVEAGRFREEGLEYPIVVRLQPEDRLNSQDLRNVSLTTPAGASVPLSALVEWRRDRAPVSIERVDGQRVTYVTAGLDASDVGLEDAADVAHRQAQLG
ncbi:MAG TPA: efflux RND transporter permease subunit, partial [Thermoanaerobaculia bacterium]|nr:efflux RND transporter permease subunit [Thermoanaerobaculia bacterium]